MYDQGEGALGETGVREAGRAEEIRSPRGRRSAQYSRCRYSSLKDNVCLKWCLFASIPDAGTVH